MLMATERSPLVLNLTIPSTLDVVTLFSTTLTFLPAGVFPILTTVAVATGAYLKSVGKS
jgi:hypothetical protein